MLRIFYNQQFQDHQEYLVLNVKLILTLKTLIKFGNKMLNSVICKYTTNTKENIS